MMKVNRLSGAEAGWLGRSDTLGAAFGLLALIALGAPQARAADAVVSCPATITSCGCTITDSAVHTLGADINAGQGLTSLGDCIDIKHAGGTLDGDDKSFSIFGSGSGVGVRILKGAVRAAVQNIKDIEDWATGIEDDANRAAITHIEDIDFNVTGILLKSAKRSVLDDFDASDNTGSGIVLVNSNNNVTEDWDADDNGADNVTLTRSNGNALTDCDTDDSVGGSGTTFTSSSRNVFVDCDADDNKANGVEVDKGSRNNAITYNTATGNGSTDLVDGNTNCDKDLWANDCFVTSSQACIGVPASRC